MKPLADNYVCVRLEFYQLQGTRIKGDTADCFVFDAEGKRHDGNRSWKNGNGFRAEELRSLAQKIRGDRTAPDLLRLSWFMVDPEFYRKDVTDDGANRRYLNPLRPVGEARKARRPLIRVEGSALRLLEEHQEFLKRHLRQFWWAKGNPEGPSRLVVFDSNDFPEGASPDDVTGPFPKGKVPAVMAAIEFEGEVDLQKVSPVLDQCWRRYMTKRPVNNISIHRDNPNYSREYEERYERMEEHIRKLAREGRLVAPGGRPLMKNAPR